MAGKTAEEEAMTLFHPKRTSDYQKLKQLQCAPIIMKRPFITTG
jgi:hypothetical protein